MSNAARPFVLPSILGGAILAAAAMVAAPPAQAQVQQSGGLQDQAGNGLGFVRGRVVLDRERRVPMKTGFHWVSAVDVATGSLAASESTDDQGRFELSLPPGEYTIASTLGFDESTTLEAGQFPTNYPGDLATVDWTVTSGQVLDLPDIVHPDPVFLHSGYTSSMSIWTQQYGYDGLMEYLTADPRTPEKQNLTGPGGMPVSVPAFMVVRIPNEDEALPGQVGYNPGVLANLFYSYTWHNTNAARFKVHLDAGLQFCEDFLGVTKSQVRPSVVCHSMGGLITRALVKTYSTTIEDIVCYDTPHGGTSYLNSLNPPALDENPLNGWLGRFCILITNNCAAYSLYGENWNAAHHEYSSSPRDWLLYECAPDPIVAPESTSNGSKVSTAFGSGRRLKYKNYVGPWIFEDAWDWKGWLGGSVRTRVNDLHKEDANNPTEVIFRNPTRHRETGLWLAYDVVPPPVVPSPVASAPPFEVAGLASLGLIAEAQAGGTARASFHPGSERELWIRAEVTPATASLMVLDPNGLALPLEDHFERGGVHQFRLSVPAGAAFQTLALEITAPLEAAATLRSAVYFPLGSHLTVDPDEPVVSAHDPVVLTARIGALDRTLTTVEALSADSPGQVIATIARPDETTFTIALADDGLAPDEYRGDGLWTALVPDTTLEGPYSVLTHARLDGALGTIERSARTSFVVQPTGARLVGGVSASALDENGDGQLEGLRFTTSIVVEREGLLRVRGVLEDANGQPIDTPAAVVRSTAGGGAFTVELDVPGAVLARSAGGPFRLTRLSVDDQELGALPIDVTVTDITTEAYAATRFAE